MHLLTRAELMTLAEPTPGGDQVSLFMPTHRYEGVDADRLRWKNLVAGVEHVLADRLRRPDLDALLAPARELYEEAEEWQHMSDGLAMFLRPGWHRSYRVPAPVPALATVGGGLVLGPLLRLLSGDEHFLVLALSQREVRLMEGSRNVVEEVRLSDVPTSLRDVVESPEPRSDAMARPAGDAGRGGRAVFYGHGAGDRHLKNDEVVRFLRAVSTGLEDVLAGVTSPMVLVGLGQLVAAYREVNAYGHVLDEAVDHHPDQLSVEELHARAWPVVERRLRERRAGVIEHFHEMSGTARASSDLGAVSRAATEGRVETLFVQADPWCWEGISEEPEPVVRLGADERYAACEEVDRAAVATLAHGGQVYATSQVVAPDSEVAAILRY